MGSIAGSNPSKPLCHARRYVIKQSVNVLIPVNQIDPIRKQLLLSYRVIRLQSNQKLAEKPFNFDFNSPVRGCPTIKLQVFCLPASYCSKMEKKGKTRCRSKRWLTRWNKALPDVCFLLSTNKTSLTAAKSPHRAAHERSGRSRHNKSSEGRARRNRKGPGRRDLY